jgi:hypothetical protein
MGFIPLSRRIGDSSRTSPAVGNLKGEADSYVFKRGSNCSLVGRQHSAAVLEGNDYPRCDASSLRELVARPFQDVARLPALFGTHLLRTTVRTRATRAGAMSVIIAARARTLCMSFSDYAHKLFEGVRIRQRSGWVVRFPPNPLDVGNAFWPA